MGVGGEKIQDQPVEKEAVKDSKNIKDNLNKNSEKVPEHAFDIAKNAVENRSQEEQAEDQKTEERIRLADSLKTLDSEQAEFRRGRTNAKKNPNSPLYKGLITEYVSQIYKNKPNDVNDVGLMKALSDLTLQADDIQQIKNYIQEQKSADQINKMYEGNYSSMILPIGTKGVLNTLRDNIEKKEIEYKREQLRKSMKDKVKSELEIGGFTDKDAIQKIIKGLDKLIDKETEAMKDTEVVSTYRTMKNDKKSGFENVIVDALNEQAARQNRLFLKEKISKLSLLNPTEIAKFQTMIDETKKPDDINTLTSAVIKDPQILTELRKKVKARGEDENSVRFANAEITNATDKGKITAIEQSKDTPGKYTKQLEAKKVTSSIEKSKDLIGKVLDTYLQNKTTKEVSINIPAGNDAVYKQVQDILSTTKNPNNINIILNQQEGLKNVMITSKETVETPDTIKFKIPALEANTIRPKDEQIKGETIMNLFKNADPKMKEILENPKYKIIGGDIAGFASRNKTGYENKTPFDLGNNVNIIVPVKEADNDGKNDDVSNNPDLAYNRSASLIDSLLNNTDNKVIPNAKFNLLYEVTGDTRTQLTESLTKKNGKAPSEKQIEEAFKEWQYATIDLKVIKTEIKTNVQEIPIENTESAMGFAVNIIGQTKGTSGFDWKPGRRSLGDGIFTPSGSNNSVCPKW